MSIIFSLSLNNDLNVDPFLTESYHMTYNKAAIITENKKNHYNVIKCNLNSNDKFKGWQNLLLEVFIKLLD